MIPLQYQAECPECQSSIVHDYNKGEYICRTCGYVVIEEADDYGPETHSTDVEERNKNTRASGSTSYSLHDFGLRTEISAASRDYSGKSIDYQVVEQMNKARKWHTRIRVNSPKDRRLSNVLSKINEMCSILGLPKSLVETASMIYRNFESTCEAKGKSIVCIATATIYLACRRCGIVRSLEEIIKAAGISEHDRSSVKLASKYYRSMVMDMNCSSDIILSSSSSTSQNLSQESVLRPSMPSESDIVTSNRTKNSRSIYSMIPTSANVAIDHYISKLVNISKIDTRVERLAIDIAHKTNNHLLADGKAPNGLAAAYIYLAAVLLGINLLQIDISNFAGITEVTIRNRCKDIFSNFKLMIKVKPG
ncbi:MAG TPA: TFIIB-type zinc ribbon-containing protein [Nitrososphaeraceae archaeon]|jgi:transcription initiation factor TFIIB